MELVHLLPTRDTASTKRFRGHAESRAGELNTVEMKKSVARSWAAIDLAYITISSM